jgi:hypothetical protein
VADFSRDVRRILREAGCYFVQQGKGDHEIWYMYGYEEWQMEWWIARRRGRRVFDTPDTAQF